MISKFVEDQMRVKIRLYKKTFIPKVLKIFINKPDGFLPVERIITPE